METKIVYVKEESFVITSSSLSKAILLAYKGGFDNGILLAQDPMHNNIIPSEQVLKEVFEVLESGMADVE